MYFWAAETTFIDEECWIYTWTCNWNDIRIAENQATRWWTTTSYKIETKSWPNKNQRKYLDVVQDSSCNIQNSNSSKY